MGSHAAKLVAFCLAVGCLVGPASAAAAPTIDGTFPLSSELGSNNKIVAGPDGNIWVTVEDATKDVARITPSGQVQEFDIEGIENAVGIVPGPDGNLWVTDVEKAAHFSPADPEGTDQAFTVAGIGAESQIVAGPDGQMWVASNNSVVNFSPGDPTNTVLAIIVSGNLAPKDIDVAGSRIVIAEGGAENRIVTFTTTGEQKDFAIGGASQGVAGGPGGQIAFSAPGATPEQSGLISPPNPAQSFELVGDPFGVTFGADGAYWIVQFAAGQLARVSTDGQLSFPIQGLPKESARQITAGPGGTLWVTLQKNGEPGAVVRISGVEAPQPAGPTSTTPTTPTAAQPPQTNLAKGKKLFKAHAKEAKVRFRFSSPTTGTSFQCSLTKLRGKKGKAPSFKPCKSPKTYPLAPGRYRFAVRALNGSLLDPTPATRTIRVVHLH
jgi:virginiamycin B lyase